MKSDGLQARIEHGIAELRGAYPHIEVCHAALEDWQEGGQTSFGLLLDIRWAQHQSLISGPARASAEAAVHDAFELAARELKGPHA